MATQIKHLGDIERHLSKEGIEQLAATDAEGVIEAAQFDPLKVYIELKRYEVYLKELISQFKEPALQKASAHGEPTFEYLNARVHISEWSKWDYSGDAGWKELNESITRLNESRKERERYLKDHNLINREVDTETGEIIEEFRLPREIGRRLVIRLL